MNNGFSIIELLVVMTISLVIFSLVISNLIEGIEIGKKVTSRHKLLESLFFTVDTIKNDLTKCGMRLQEASSIFNLQLFSHSDSGFKIIYGLDEGVLLENSYIGDNKIEISKEKIVTKGTKILIYDPIGKQYEFSEVKKISGQSLLLKFELKKEHLKHSIIIPLKEIEMKLYKKQKVLKRKIDKGYFQPVIEGVTDFYISFLNDSNSVLYRLEINNREQIRGYIFLSNMAGL